MAVRVLWVVKGLGPGGAEHLLSAAARAHDDERFALECAYVLPWKDHLVDELERAGVRTHCLSRRRTDPRWPWRLVALVRTGDFDVVHVHSPLPGSVARIAVRSIVAARRPGLVSTEHNRWATHQPPTRALNRFTGRFDDVRYAVTDEVNASMAGSAGARARTLRHGIDVERVRAALDRRGVMREELRIGPDEFVVGTVANFREQKDYPNLLAAARLLDDRGRPVRFVAVGQGPQEVEVRRLRDHLQLGDRFVFTGFRPDAVDVMAACDAFVLASKWEGLPIALMEATALGLPIVSTRVGGVAEEFRDQVDALLVPPSDPVQLSEAIERLATDSALRRRLAAASAARAADFDVRRSVGVLEATYVKIARDQPADLTGQATTPPVKLTRAETPSLDIRPAIDDDRTSIIELLQRSLGGDGDARYPALFAWKHDENRFGRSPMWVAVDGGRIVAFRTLMRWEFRRGDKLLRAVRAVDTATDPEYQGRGLFRALTLHGVDQVRHEGVDFVFNTPNSQSRPGYLKMGWREVGRLPVSVAFTGPAGAMAALRSRVPADRWSQPLDIGESVGEWIDRGGPDGRWPTPAHVREIRTNADEAFLRWRFDTVLLGYRVIDDGESAAIVRSRRRGSALELAVVATFGEARAVDRLAAAAACAAGASYAIRLGQAQMSSSPMFVGLPGGGPVLTWRAVNDLGEPPLSNWALTLGDIELF